MAAGWWGPSSLCWGLEAGSEREKEEQILRQALNSDHGSELYKSLTSVELQKYKNPGFDLFEEKKKKKRL